MLLAPVDQQLLAITGSPGVGNRLTALVQAGITGAFQWKADGVVIAGATQSFYDQVSGDVGKSITVELSAVVFASAGLVVPSAGITGTPWDGNTSWDGPINWN